MWERKFGRSRPTQGQKLETRAATSSSVNELRKTTIRKVEGNGHRQITSTGETYDLSVYSPARVSVVRHPSTADASLTSYAIRKVHGVRRKKRYEIDKVQYYPAPPTGPLPEDRQVLLDIGVAATEEAMRDRDEIESLTGLPSTSEAEIRKVIEAIRTGTVKGK